MPTRKKARTKKAAPPRAVKELRAALDACHVRLRDLIRENGALHAQCARQQALLDVAGDALQRRVHGGA